MGRRVYTKALCSLSIVICLIGFMTLADSDVGSVSRGDCRAGIGRAMQNDRIVGADRSDEGLGQDQVKEKSHKSFHDEEVTVDHGDTLISDEHESFMDRGFRAYQDLIEVDPNSKIYDTYVNVVYGNLFHTRRDIYITGRGLPLEIAFIYNSGSFFDGRYGYGWQMNYNVRYVTNTDNENVIVVRPDDRTDIFTKNPDETFKSTYGVGDSLIALQQGYKLIVWQDRWNGDGDYVVYYFDSPDHHYVTRIEDRNGNTLTFTYNDDKQLITVADGSGRALNFNYVNSKLTKITDPSGREFYYEYNTNGDMVKVTNPLDGTICYTYTQDCHDCISMINPNGNTIQFAYNSDFAISTVTSPLNNTAFEFSYEWTTSGNTSVTDANGYTTVFTYDEKDRVIAITGALGNTITRSLDSNYHVTSTTDANSNVITYTYDTRGNMLTRTNALGNRSTFTWETAYNKITSRTDANGNTSTYNYDANGNLSNMIDPLGNTTTYTYDSYGQILSMTNAMGNTMTYEYDTFGNKIRIIDALGNETMYGYDGNGNMLYGTYANGNQWNYEHDALNRCTKGISPMGHQTVLSFDDAGNRTSRTDPNGATISYLYDAAERLTRISYPDGSQVDHDYDGVGNLIRVTSTRGLGDRTEKTYDALNRPTATTVDFGSFSKTVFYSYDASGNLVTLTDPDGKTRIYEYDEADRLIEITDPWGGITTRTYDPAGRKTETHFPHDVWSAYSYDNGDRMTVITTQDSVNDLVFQYGYTYDALGQMLGVVKNGVNEAIYQYNASNWLTDATYSTGQDIHYTYDPIGKRLTQEDNGNVISFTYNTENRVSTQTFPDMSTITYTYDKNGNVIQTTSDWGVTTYEYDYENRLTSIHYPAAYGTIEQYYSPEGELLARNERGEWTYYFPTFLGTVVEMDAQGNTTTCLNPGISLAKEGSLNKAAENKQVTYIHWDGLGNTTYFTGQSVVASFVFDFFGGMLDYSGNVEEVDPGLFASNMQVYWDPMLGSELIGRDYATAIDQHFGDPPFDPGENICGGDNYRPPWARNGFWWCGKWYPPGTKYPPPMPPPIPPPSRSELREIAIRNAAMKAARKLAKQAREWAFKAMEKWNEKVLKTFESLF